MKRVGNRPLIVSDIDIGIRIFHTEVVAGVTVCIVCTSAVKGFVDLVSRLILTDVGAVPHVEVLRGEVDSDRAASACFDRVRAVAENALVRAGRVEAVNDAVVIRCKEQIGVKPVFDVFRTIGQTGEVLAQAGNEFQIEFFVAVGVVTQSEIRIIAVLAGFVNNVPIRFRSVNFFIVCTEAERVMEIVAVIFVSDVEVRHGAAFVCNAIKVAIFRNGVQIVSNPRQTGQLAAVSVDVAVKDEDRVVVGINLFQFAGKHDVFAGNGRLNGVFIFAIFQLEVFNRAIDKAGNLVSLIISVNANANDVRSFCNACSAESAQDVFTMSEDSRIASVEFVRRQVVNRNSVANGRNEVAVCVLSYIAMEERSVNAGNVLINSVANRLVKFRQPGVDVRRSFACRPFRKRNCDVAVRYACESNLSNPWLGGLRRIREQGVEGNTTDFFVVLSHIFVGVVPTCNSGNTRFVELSNNFSHQRHGRFIVIDDNRIGAFWSLGAIGFWQCTVGEEDDFGSWIFFINVDKQKLVAVGNCRILSNFKNLSAVKLERLAGNGERLTVANLQAAHRVYHQVNACVEFDNNVVQSGFLFKLERELMSIAQIKLRRIRTGIRSVFRLERKSGKQVRQRNVVGSSLGCIVLTAFKRMNCTVVVDHVQQVLVEVNAGNLTSQVADDEHRAVGILVAGSVFVSKDNRFITNASRVVVNSFQTVFTH